MIEAVIFDLDGALLDSEPVWDPARGEVVAPPLAPGALEAVRRIWQRWPLGLVSSSNRPVVDTVLAVTSMAPYFQATVSSEEVRHATPGPDGYRAVARRLGVAPERCAAVEESANGLRSAAAAGMRVVAIAGAGSSPPPDALALAAVTLADLGSLTVEVIGGAAGSPQWGDGRLDEVEEESFPASDSHTDWAGPSD